MRGSIRPWRPPGFLLFSGLVALVCAVGAAFQPQHWAAFLAVALATQVVLIGSGFIPKSRLLGANLSRMSAVGGQPNRVALTFDDGPDPEVTPEVLKILAKYQVQATFFCVGKRAEENPELVARITEAGHNLGNHSWSHSHGFWFFGPRRLREEIGLTQKVLLELGGQRTAVFRAPAGIRSPILDAVLAEFGLILVSWTRRGFDTVDRNPKRVLHRLTSSLATGGILLLHDGSAARTSDGIPVVLEVLPPLLDEVHRRGFVTGPLIVD